VENLLDPSPEAGLPIDYQKAKEAKQFVMKASLVACVSSVLLGYDIGVLSGAIIFMRIDLQLSTVQEEILVASLNLMAVPGAFIAGVIADKFGRRRAILCASVVFFVGALLMVCAQSFGLLLLGRCVTGLGLGCGLLVGPLYTAELSPKDMRGTLVSLGEIFISIGILIGFVVNLALVDLPPHIAWRLMVSGGLLPAFVLFIMVQLMHESPQWLMSQGRDNDAIQVLEKGCPSDHEVQIRVKEIRDDLEAEKTQEWRELSSPAPAIRHCLFVGTGIAFFQQATGIESVMYYAPHTFNEAGMEGTTAMLAATMAVGLVKLVATVGAAVLLDDVGRRPLLILSSFGVVASLGLITASIILKLPVITIMGLCLFVAFFAVGYGPVCWIIMSEIFPLRVRGSAMSISTALNRFTSFFVAVTFLSFCKAMSTAGCYALYTLINCIGVYFCVYYVPETCGLSLEEISRAMASKSPFLHQPEFESAPKFGGATVADDQVVQSHFASPDANLVDTGI